jgi:hypothetical protein
MKMFIVVIASSMLAWAASAEEPAKEAKPQGLLVITAQNYSSPMFQMGPDGCLRGPLTFFDPAQNIVFHLDAGKWFPTTCEPKAAPR